MHIFMRFIFFIYIDFDDQIHQILSRDNLRIKVTKKKFPITFYRVFENRYLRIKKINQSSFKLEKNFFLKLLLLTEKVMSTHLNITLLSCIYINTKNPPLCSNLREHL